jgi:hypothetical protein
MSPRARTAGVLLGALIVLLTSCGTSDTPSTATSGMTAASGSMSAPTPARSYVGTVAGTSALLSVVVDGKRILGYACDGKPGDGMAGTTPTIQTWFNGPSDGRTVDITRPAGHLQVQLTDTAMTGTLTLADGRPAAVTGTLVTGESGLFRAENDAAIGGWIRAANGEQRGAIGTKGVDGGGGVGTVLLKPSQTSITFNRLSSTKISQVGITMIPIP